MSDMHNMQMKGRLPCMDYVCIKSMKYQLSNDSGCGPITTLLVALSQ